MPILAAYVVPHPPIIMPEVGRGEEKRISRTIEAYREACRRAAELRPDTIVLTSPHAALCADYFHISPGGHARGDLGRFGARSVAVEASYDTKFAEELSREAKAESIPAGPLGRRDTELDHGTIIPLAFLNEYYRQYKLVRIGLSGLSPLVHYRLGKCIAKTADKLDRRVVFIASGDLSHKLTADGPYGFAPQGPEFDRRVTEALSAGDFLKLLQFEDDFCAEAAECGLRSFQIMAGVLDGKSVESELLSYEGPFGVGYGIAAFKVKGEDTSCRFDRRLYADKNIGLDGPGEDAYVRLARLSLETFIKTGKRARLPDDLPEEMLSSRAGAFVSLKIGNQLRGCIGTILPTTGSVAEEILRNAVSSGTEDPRFPPVTKDELPLLTYSVDVLGEPEPIDSPDKLDVKRYGVIVSSGYRRGLLLPNLEGVDTVEEQIEIARQKAGIRPGEKYTLQRFEVVRHK